MKIHDINADQLLLVAELINDLAELQKMPQIIGSFDVQIQSRIEQLENVKRNQIEHELVVSYWIDEETEMRASENGNQYLPTIPKIRIPIEHKSQLERHINFALQSIKFELYGYDLLEVDGGHSVIQVQQYGEKTKPVLNEIGLKHNEYKVLLIKDDHFSGRTFCDLMDNEIGLTIDNFIHEGVKAGENYRLKNYLLTSENNINHLYEIKTKK